MLNFIYIVQSKWYLRLKISVQRPFKLQLNKNYDAVLKIEQNPIPSKYQH